MVERVAEPGFAALRENAGKFGSRRIRRGNCKVISGSAHAVRYHRDPVNIGARPNQLDRLPRYSGHTGIGFAISVSVSHEDAIGAECSLTAVMRTA